MLNELQKLGGTAEKKTPESSVAQVVKFASAKGYEFTVEDLRAFEGESQELSEEELNKINAAGIYGNLSNVDSSRCLPIASIL